MMKKLSKLIAVVAAMALMMGMTVSAFAASPTVPEATNVTSPSGDVIPSTMPDSVVEKYFPDDGSSLEENVKDILGTVQNDQAAKDILAAVKNDPNNNIEILWIDNLSVTDKNGNPVASPTLVFNLENVAKGTTVYALHFVNGAWELLSGVFNGTTVSINFPNGLSPVVLFLAKDAVTGKYVATQANTHTDIAGNLVKSPKTGF